METGILTGVQFGDKFKLRNDKWASFVVYSSGYVLDAPKRYMFAVEGECELYYYGIHGNCVCGPDFVDKKDAIPFDIVSKWTDEYNEENIDKMSDAYVKKRSDFNNDTPEYMIFVGLAEKAAYEAGFYDALRCMQYVNKQD